MELWVRSQNKEAIIKVNMGLMYWEDVNKRNCIVNKDNAKGLSILGAYKTKERALEVLDEIQNRLINIQVFMKDEKVLKNNNPMYLYMECVYQMPEE